MYYIPDRKKNHGHIKEINNIFVDTINLPRDFDYLFKTINC